MAICAPISDTRNCHRCGHRADEGTRFCSRCGLRVRVDAPASPPSACTAVEQGRRLRARGLDWFALALRSFREAARENPSSVQPILEIARTYQLMNLPLRARRWYRRAVRLSPGCEQAWLEGACCFPRDAHFRRALWLHRALVLRPGDRVLAAEIVRHMHKLVGWQRRWIERRIWKLYRTELMEGCHSSC